MKPGGRTTERIKPLVTAVSRGWFSCPEPGLAPTLLEADLGGSDVDARVFPSFEKVIASTESVWPSRVCRHWPVVGSQSRTVWSSDADARSSHPLRR
jgi:hypothetical protein